MGARISIYQNTKEEEEGIGSICGIRKICVTKDPDKKQIGYIRDAVKIVRKIMSWLEEKLGGELKLSNHSLKIFDEKSSSVSLSDTDILEWVKRDATFALHGSSTAADVVDENYKVFGTKGLYIVDASVLKNSLDANPAATLFSMGEYLGENF